MISMAKNLEEDQMLRNYELYIDGYGHYQVEASVCKIPSLEEEEWEVEILLVRKFDDFLENYMRHTPSKKERLLLEKEVAVKFFNTLH